MTAIGPRSECERTGSHGIFALQAASADGHEMIVHLLLDRGADVNTMGGPYGNASQVATSEGHKTNVCLPLN